MRRNALCRNSRLRNRHRKPCAAEIRLANGDRALVHLDELFRDREAQTCPRDLAADPAIDLPESLEDGVSQVRRDSWSRIVDRQIQFVATRTKATPDSATI